MAVLTAPFAEPARIIPAEYTSAEIAAEEQQGLFGRVWQWVGFTDEVTMFGACLRASIAGMPVIITRSAGTLRGCRDLCPSCHISLSAPGPLCPRCGFHPFSGDNPLAAAVESCGRFIFVRLLPGPDLRDFLAPLFDTLAELSETFTDPGEDSAALWACNWKLAVESAIEVYHARLIHPTTLVPYAPDGTNFEGAVQGWHSFGRFGIATESAAWWDRVAKRLKLTRLARYPAYDHFHIFPNLMIPLSAGALMAVQIYEPLGPAATRMRYRLRFGTAQGPQNAAIRREIEASLARFNRQVIAEDIAITAEVQHGAGEAERPALLGSNEWRIRHFQAGYRRWRAR